MRVFGRNGISILIASATFGITAFAQTVPNRATPAKDPKSPLEAEGYIQPPASVAKLVAAPRMNNFTWGTPSTTRKFLLHALSEEPTLATLGKRHYNLGGWQIDPAGNRSRAMTTRSTTGYELLDWAANKTIKVDVPAGTRGSTYTSWSPDGLTFAYFAQFPDATQIYLADPNTGKSRPLTKTGVVATNVGNFEWTADGKSIITVLVPDNRGPEPKQPEIADGIKVRVNENNMLKTRNYPDLIESPYEKKLFEYYNIGQLAIVDVKKGTVTKVGAPGPITRIDPSPDAKFFRVTYLDQPYSYILPVSSFGSHEVIIDGTGKELKLMSTRELQEGTPTGIVDPTDPNAGGGRGGRGGAAADTARRNLAWHPFEGGLIFARSAIMDSVAKAHADSVARASGRGARAGGGGAGRGAGGAGGRGAAADSLPPVPTRPDTLFLWSAPFVGSNTTILKPLYVTPARGTINSVEFSENGRIMFVTETLVTDTVRRTTATTTDAIFLDENNAKFTVMRSAGGGGAGGRGRGGAGAGGRGGAVGGGPLLTKEGNRGTTVVLMSNDGKYVYTTQPEMGANGGRGRGGRGAVPADSANAPRVQPFVDKIEVKTGTRTRVYQATVADLTESAATPLDNDFTKAIVTRQSTKVPPESFLVDIATKNATQLTHSTDYWPEITNTIKKTVMARRPDGLNIRIRVTLPADWKEGTKLPALFWFYPAEFDSDSAYTASLTGGRGGAGATPRPGDPGTFPAMGQRTMSFITAAGYALVENDAPIVGTPGKLPNDNYVTDLQWDLYAAVNALDTLKLVDKERLAIGGHSYGAFSTVNALVHTPYFKAGIAGDGMYNRTLTPNGFQNERRDLWTGQTTYLEMSPMLSADKMTGALLMYHSMEDQNVGTDPISSIRMYQALIGQGKTTALYMYPYEDHGPVARESNLDQWARWVAWLDKYVKNPQQPKPKAQ